jgi:hypothetical protein
MFHRAGTRFGLMDMMVWTAILGVWTFLASGPLDVIRGLLWGR